MIFFLYLGPAVGLVALVIALLFVSTRRRYEAGWAVGRDGRPSDPRDADAGG